MGTFRYYAKFRFHGERKFFFEGQDGGATDKKIFAIHRGELRDFAPLVDAARDYGSVAEMRIYENIPGAKNPREIERFVF